MKFSVIIYYLSTIIALPGLMRGGSDISDNVMASISAVLHPICARTDATPQWLALCSVLSLTLLSVSRPSSAVMRESRSDDTYISPLLSFLSNCNVSTPGGNYFSGKLCYNSSVRNVCYFNIILSFSHIFEDIISPFVC